MTLDDAQTKTSRPDRRALGVLGLAVGLVLFALRDNIVFFYGPTELAEKAPPPGARLRIGGLVKQGSLGARGQRERSLSPSPTEAGRRR